MSYDQQLADALRDLSEARTHVVIWSEAANDLGRELGALRARVAELEACVAEQEHDGDHYARGYEDGLLVGGRANEPLRDFVRELVGEGGPLASGYVNDEETGRLVERNYQWRQRALALLGDPDGGGGGS